MRPLPRAAATVSIAIAVLSLAGCERLMRGMYEQPKLKTAATSPLFADTLASRPPPPGSIARSIGEPASDSSGVRGDDTVAALDAADARTALPIPVDAAMQARGRERYAIHCAPCHGAAGDGDGMVVQRGFPAPPSLRIERLRTATDRHFFEVITSGYGVMRPYAARVDASDRWAVVAYIRRLQQGPSPTSAVVGTQTPSTTGDISR